MHTAYCAGAQTIYSSLYFCLDITIFRNRKIVINLRQNGYQGKMLHKLSTGGKLKVHWWTFNPIMGLKINLGNSLSLK